jgi:hypothetical protein
VTSHAEAIQARPSCAPSTGQQWSTSNTCRHTNRQATVLFRLIRANSHAENDTRTVTASVSVSVSVLVNSGPFDTATSGPLSCGNDGTGRSRTVRSGIGNRVGC